MGDLIAQADKYLSERAFDQALDSYDKALERQKSQGDDAVEDPVELSRVMYRRGTVLLLKDKQQLALDDFEAALALNPKMHKASIKIAEALLRQGEFLKSIQRLEPYRSQGHGRERPKTDHGGCQQWLGEHRSRSQGLPVDPGVPGQGAAH